MSTDADEEALAAGVPELTALGKRIELLRIERRMSKRVLAQRAGTSRQQLWRVMTGKSELTSSLCARLSDVLETDSRILRDVDRTAHEGSALAARMRAAGPRGHRGNGSGGDGMSEHDVERFCETLDEYLSSPSGLERTLGTLPPGDDGRRLKRVLLDAIDDIAMARAIKLPQSVFDLRRSVVNDD